MRGVKKRRGGDDMFLSNPLLLSFCCREAPLISPERKRERATLQSRTTFDDNCSGRVKTIAPDLLFAATSLPIALPPTDRGGCLPVITKKGR